jgi:uncharacterized membrane protein YeiB
LKKQRTTSSSSSKVWFLTSYSYKSLSNLSNMPFICYLFSNSICLLLFYIYLFLFTSQPIIDELFSSLHANYNIEYNS